MPDIIDPNIYTEIKQILDTARSRAYSAVNVFMVEAYWNIGKVIVNKQGGKKRAEYGEKLLEHLSAKLTKDYGKGFDIINLGRMKQFYLLFPNIDALRQESFISNSPRTARRIDRRMYTLEVSNA